MFGHKSAMVVVYIDRNWLQFYGGSFASILKLDIPLTIVRDLEIVNRDGLYALVNQWLKQNNVGKVRLFFVLSPTTYFEKEIVGMSESEQETEILAFYDFVPFDDLATNVLTIEGEKHAIAANRDYLEGLHHAFTLQGYQSIAMIPATALGPLVAKRWLDNELGSYVVSHAEALRFQTILPMEEQNPALPALNASIPTTKTNPRLMILVGMFGVLLLVLIVLFFVHH